jgi:hypothetical protein
LTTEASTVSWLICCSTFLSLAFCCSDPAVWSCSTAAFVRTIWLDLQLSVCISFPSTRRLNMNWNGTIVYICQVMLLVISRNSLKIVHASVNVQVFCTSHMNKCSIVLYWKWSRICMYSRFMPLVVAGMV